MSTSPVAVPGAKLKRRPPAERPVVHYADSDGHPMAENDPQRICIVDTHFALHARYAGDPQVYASADLLVYYVEGDPNKSVAPDVLVSFDVPKRHRRSYRIWEEGKPPDVVFEFASENSWQADLGWKRGLYLGLGVQEYFLFDPTGEYFDPILQGYRLVEENYQPVTPLPDSNAPLLGLWSEVLGLELWVQENGGEGMPYVLRFYDPETDTWLSTPDEERAARQAAEARAAEEAKARRQAEAELARMQAELARVRGESQAEGEDES